MLCHMAHILWLFSWNLSDSNTILTGNARQNDCQVALAEKSINQKASDGCQQSVTNMLVPHLCLLRPACCNEEGPLEPGAIPLVRMLSVASSPLPAGMTNLASTQLEDFCSRQHAGFPRITSNQIFLWTTKARAKLCSSKGLVWLLKCRVSNCSRSSLVRRVAEAEMGA